MAQDKTTFDDAFYEKSIHSNEEEEEQLMEEAQVLEEHKEEESKEGRNVPRVSNDRRTMGQPATRRAINRVRRTSNQHFI